MTADIAGRDAQAPQGGIMHFHNHFSDALLLICIAICIYAALRK